MTGQTETAPPTEPPAPPADATEEAAPAKPDPKEPHLKADPKHDAPAPAPAPAPAESQPAGVFGGWAFDVNTVTGNLGGLFTAADPTVTDEFEGRSLAEPAEDMGAAAANIANVATVELEHASKAAQQTIGKAAEEIGKGWGTLNSFLDDMLASKPDAGKEEPDDDADVHNKFHTLFPELEKDDEVVDHFKCALLQKYRCYLNNATPEKSYALRGRLYVSTLHLAMYILDDGGEFGGRSFGISVPFSDVARVQKGAKSMLRVVTKSQTSLIFADFESDSHFSGALSLLEHMQSSAAAAPPPEPEAGAEVEPEEEKEAAATG